MKCFSHLCKKKVESIICDGYFDGFPIEGMMQNLDGRGDYSTDFQIEGKFFSKDMDLATKV